MSWSQQDLSFKKLSNKRVTTSTGKGLPEEKGASALELYLPDIKTELIPGTGNTATGLNGVLYYYGPSASFGQTLVVDTSVPGNLTWFASSGYGNTTTANDGSAGSESLRLFDWVSDKYDAFGTVSGAGYEIKLYDGSGNLITKSDASNWLFDYQTGILMFNGATLSNSNAVATSGPYRIVGWRYVGQKGTIPAYFGGSGYTTYTKGDVLVGAGGTFIKLNVGSDNYVLSADSSTFTGLKWVANSGSGSGISVLNELSATTQFFAAGTSGSLFNISSSGSTHTFNIPIAGSGATGLVSTGSQTIAGSKTFANDFVVSSSTVSTSTSTGALTITGGVGIGGSLFTGTSTADSISGVVLSNGVITSGSWAGTAITTLYGGTGLTSIISGNAFLSSNSAGTALTYRSFTAGFGMQIAVSPNDVTFATTGTVTGTGTSGYLPMWTASGTALTDSIINQYDSVIIVSGSIKAITKSFKIDHPLDPENKYLEHGSLEGPEHGIYQRGRASGYKEVEVLMPDYFMALGEDSYSIQITPRVNANLYVSESNVKGFKVKRIGGFIFSNQYIEFDYFVVAERKDVKIELIQSKK